MFAPFCTLDEAFSGAPAPAHAQPKKLKKKQREGLSVEQFACGGATSLLKNSYGVEQFMGQQLPSSPNPDHIAQIMATAPEPMKGPEQPMNHMRLESGVNMQEFFPLPGETAEPDEWQKAFMLEPSQGPPVTRPDGSVSVAGRSTLWRQIPVPVGPSAAAEAAPIRESSRTAMTVTGTPLIGSPVSGDFAAVQQRLDALTRQLENLGAPSQMQSTAELFLFVAIGLMLLLAIDTLLRFATRMAAARQGGGSISNSVGKGSGMRFRGRRWA
jgi:hypothetical protein